MSDWTPGSKATRFLGVVGTPLLYAVGAWPRLALRASRPPSSPA